MDEDNRLIENWWNGVHGGGARRDIWLSANPDGSRWMVEIFTGANFTEDRASWIFADESEARQWLARCFELGGEGWRQMPPGHTEPEGRTEPDADSR